MTEKKKSCYLLDVLHGVNESESKIFIQHRNTSKKRKVI